MKIYIIGTSGAGKTTLARRLVQETKLRYVELDDLYWLPNWSECDPEEFLSKVKSATENNNWVACGNYRQVKGFLMEQADLIVWLDFSFLRVFSQAFRRTIKNIITRTPIAGNNQETFYQQFFTKKSLLLWIIQTHRRRRRNYLNMMTEGQYCTKWVRISNQKDYEKFVMQVQQSLATIR